ncbi:MAG TPA: hypothetical protein VL463_22780 [Kofleriaceae bacterium]|nr:hypothetical protein [Kofleriaceae bacterium]
MSYDLYVESDRERSDHRTLGDVVDFLARVQHVRGSGASWCFEDPARDRHMEIDLEWEEGGESWGCTRDLDEAKWPDARFNVINLHVPYACIHSNADDDAYFELALALAALLGWRVYDAQLDRHLVPGARLPRARSI